MNSIHELEKAIRDKDARRIAIRMHMLRVQIDDLQKKAEAYSDLKEEHAKLKMSHSYLDKEFSKLKKEHTKLKRAKPHKA
jgi:hypothetical protein